MAIVRIPIELTKSLFSKTVAIALLGIGFFSIVFGTAPKIFSGYGQSGEAHADAPSSCSCGETSSCSGSSCVWACSGTGDPYNDPTGGSSGCYGDCGKAGDDCGGVGCAHSEGDCMTGDCSPSDCGTIE